MKPLAVLFAVLLSGLAWTGLSALGPVESPEQRLAREVLNETNIMRADPQGYIQVLQAYRTQFQADIVKRPGLIDIKTWEGVSAVDEAIRFLRRQRPMPMLPHDPVLDRVAADHVADQGPTGLVGHYGSNGRDLGDRLRYRGAQPYGGENISYGYNTAREVVIQLLVDDNVPDRGHRFNTFRDGYARMGAACGRHAVYGHMCVIDFGY